MQTAGLRVDNNLVTSKKLPSGPHQLLLVMGSYAHKEAGTSE